MKGILHSSQWLIQLTPRWNCEIGEIFLNYLLPLFPTSSWGLLPTKVLIAITFLQLTILPRPLHTPRGDIAVQPSNQLSYIKVLITDKAWASLHWKLTPWSGIALCWEDRLWREVAQGFYPSSVTLLWASHFSSLGPCFLNYHIIIIITVSTPWGEYGYQINTIGKLLSPVLSTQ